ncbi:uncharacterized protein LOC130707187 [Balaenoptera acutorostrata]|uniref:Uncharacterized protein LOC130707187 n=1 Tax=Balaenoptera acutorostrata TaxID=9767 RepID=A0ABM3T2S4_BALAC|nr:uncharacterized protein LOC130707187 [Balaenoptera acutorostrata]
MAHKNGANLLGSRLGIQTPWITCPLSQAWRAARKTLVGCPEVPEARARPSRTPRRLRDANRARSRGGGARADVGPGRIWGVAQGAVRGDVGRPGGAVAVVVAAAVAAARGRAAPGASRPSLALGPSAVLRPLLLTALAGSRQRAPGEGRAVGGGVTDGHGEGKTGAGVHEGDAVLHSAVTGREGNSCDQPSGREKKTLRGSSGDEASCSFLEIVCCEGCRYLLCRIQLLLFLLCDFEKFWFPSLQNKYVCFLSPLVLSPSLQSPPLCNCPALILLKPSLCWDSSVTFITSAVTCVLVVFSSDSEEILSLLHQARFLFLSQI